VGRAHITQVLESAEAETDDSAESGGSKMVMMLYAMVMCTTDVSS